MPVCHYSGYRTLYMLHGTRFVLFNRLNQLTITDINIAFQGITLTLENGMSFPYWRTIILVNMLWVYHYSSYWTLYTEHDLSYSIDLFNCQLLTLPDFQTIFLNSPDTWGWIMKKINYAERWWMFFTESQFRLEYSTIHSSLQYIELIQRASYMNKLIGSQATDLHAPHLLALPAERCVDSESGQKIN